jgi:hypothetical protein
VNGARNARALNARGVASKRAAKTNGELNPGAPNAPLNSNPMHAPALDPEWRAEKASEALAWLAARYPEAAGSEALHGPQDAAHAAAVAGDGEAFLEALRGYCRAGRAVALEA